MKQSFFDTTTIDGLIIGRVEPHIYAFETKTIPNYLKVGDTYRPVGVRIAEWKKIYDNLVHKSEWEWLAKVGDTETRYFRDYAVHSFLKSIGKDRLQPEDIGKNIYYSDEFFKDTNPLDVDKAIEDIKANVNTDKYKLYNEAHLPEVFTYERNDKYEPRPNQQATIDCFVEARKQGRRHLLMYAVMRFGKSFTSMCCALEMNAKVVLIVSAKADVHDEWQKTIQGHTKFEQYDFLDSNDLLKEKNAISNRIKNNRRVAVCLTLQDLIGDNIKDKHKELFSSKVDLLIVDETHFGARAEEYGKVLRNVNGLQERQIQAELTRQKNDEGQQEDVDEALKQIKSLEVDTTLHLSGTPYRILMGSEFKKEDIVAFYQFGDIVDDKEQYDKEHRDNDNYNEWDNPYYGFPQMIRFAFNPNKKSRELIERLQQNGYSAKLNELFRPKSVSKKSDGSHAKFVHEREVLDLLMVIDGSQSDENVLGFLNYDRLKEGKMCRHIVFVLPFCASCNAMKKLIADNRSIFKNLNEYEVINIAGIDNGFEDSKAIRRKVADCEKAGKKTISLTVNRMLTGSTVKEWDTMVFLKDVSSPQEYDQATFRIQNPYIVTYTNEDGDTIKKDMKPQTLLVDFDPNRMFYMQEQKSKIYNYNTENRGNERLEERLKRDLEISPIIVANKGRMEQVTATNIMDAVRKYSAEKTVMDEASDVPIDVNLLNDEDILSIIEKLAPIDAKQGLDLKPSEGEGDELPMPSSGQDKDTDEDSEENEAQKSNAKSESEEDNKLEKRLATFYAQILFFALLTEDRVKSLHDVLMVVDMGEDNKRMANNIGLKKWALELLNKRMSAPVLSDLDYKIQNINDLLKDTNVEAVNRVENAMRKFGRMSISEIVTPQKVAKEMIDLLPIENFSGNSRFLDLASKQGEFACTLYKKYVEIGNENGKKNIYAIPTSGLGYEFTRKVFELLGIPVRNIYYDFNTYDLIGENKEIIIEKLNKMKFNVIVGNPPYQVNKATENSISNFAYSTSIYHLFIDFACNLNPQYISMVTPSRWMTKGGQSIPDEWVDKMINSNGFRVIHDYSDASDLFPSVEIKGGINYFLYKCGSNKGKCKYYHHREGVVTLKDDFLNALGLGIIIRDAKASEILKKVIAIEGHYIEEASFMNLVGARDFFSTPKRLSSNWSKYVQKKDTLHNIKYYLNKKLESCGYGWIEYNDIPKGHSALPLNKVYISKSYGAGESFPHQILGVPFYGEPNSVSSLTYLIIGYDPELHNFTKEQCLNIISYIKTRFFRYLVSIKKKTQDNPRDVFQFVPMQDFSKPWTDAELYKKYNLTDDEISYIESMIKPME